MSWKDRDENLMSTYPMEAFEGADKYIAELRAENARLKETLEFIDDHGRASEAMEIMKGQKAKIDGLETGINELKRTVSKMSSAIKAMAEELNWDYQDLLKEANEKLDSTF
jgi:outer membrane murein-binding lipoprotein Lpp